jgi:hypothetical protein
VQEFNDKKFLDANIVGINFWGVTISLPEGAGMKHAAESSLEGKPQKKRKMNPPEVVPAPAAPVQPIEQPEATAPADNDFEELPPDVLEMLFAEAAKLEEQVGIRTAEATAHVRINSQDAELAEQVPSLSGSKHAAEWSPKGMPLLKKRKTNPPEDAPAPVQVVGEPNIAEADSSNEAVHSNRGSRMLNMYV